MKLLRNRLLFILFTVLGFSLIICFKGMKASASNFLDQPFFSRHRYESRNRFISPYSRGTDNGIENMGLALIELDPLTLQIKDADSFWQINKRKFRLRWNGFWELCGSFSAEGEPDASLFLFQKNPRFPATPTVYSIDLLTGRMKKQPNKNLVNSLVDKNIFYIPDGRIIYSLTGESITLPEEIAVLDYVSDGYYEDDFLLAVSHAAPSAKVWEIPLNEAGNFKGTYTHIATLNGEGEDSAICNYPSICYAKIQWKNELREVFYVSKDDLSPADADELIMVDFLTGEVLYNVSPTESGLGLTEAIQLPTGDLTNYLTWANPQGIDYVDGRLFLVCDLWYELCSPTIDIQKLVSVDGGKTYHDVDGPPYPTIAVGDDVFYKIVVTNTSFFRLVAISLSDSHYAINPAQVPNKLNRGESFQIPLGPFTAKEGQQTNTSTVTAKPCFTFCRIPVEDTDPATYFGEKPSFSFLKQINGKDADTCENTPIVVEPDTLLSFSYKVTNTGNVSITWTNLTDTTDSVITDLSSECGLPMEIDPDESESCIVIRQAEFAPNGKLNTGKVSVKDLPDKTDPACYKTPLNNPSYRFIKRINNNIVPDIENAYGASVGEELTFQYEVENTGNVAIMWTSLEDSVFGDLTLLTDCIFPISLDVGATIECRYKSEAVDAPSGTCNIGDPYVEFNGMRLPEQTFQACYKTEGGADCCTYTQGGWGTAPHGNNPGTIRDAGFGDVYPGGSVIVGDPANNTMTFTSSTAIQNYLPAGGTPSALPGDLTDPTDKKIGGGVFGGQVLALQLNVDYSAAGKLPHNCNGGLGELKLCNYSPAPALNNMLVKDILAQANIKLGGGSPDPNLSFSQYNDIVTALNEEFDNCSKKGSLTLIPGTQNCPTI